MDTVRVIVLVVHGLGIAALLAGLLVQVLPGRRDQDKSVNGLMRDGAGTAFVAGLVLVGLLEAGDEDVDHVKVTVKLLVGLVVLVLVMANVRRPTIPVGLWAGILGLTLVNLVVALVV